MKMKPQVGVLNPAGKTPGWRDAFHVPCILVRCNTSVKAGTPVDFVGRSGQLVQRTTRVSQAIVDPFLKEDAQPGDLFWVFLNPEIVNDLVHHFAVTGLDDVQPRLKFDRPVAEQLQVAADKLEELGFDEAVLKAMRDEPIDPEDWEAFQEAGDVGFHDDGCGWSC